MEQRIRVGVLILVDDKIVLVKHVHPKTGFTWWVPPGGGLEEHDSNIFECGVREVYEETGLRVEAFNIAYVREFIDIENDVMNLELFVLGKVLDGRLTTTNIYGKGRDEFFIQDVKWFSQKEMEKITVFPEILRDEFWIAMKSGLSSVAYLGRQVG